MAGQPFLGKVTNTPRAGAPGLHGDVPKVSLSVAQHSELIDHIDTLLPRDKWLWSCAVLDDSSARLVGRNLMPGQQVPAEWSDNDHV